MPDFVRVPGSLLFEGLLNRENDWTQLLCNMMEFDDFRDAVHDLLEQAVQKRKNGFPLPRFKYNDINLRPGSPETGYPDIEIENEELLLLIECKISNVPFTPKQQEAYEARFSEHGNVKNKVLAFLVPEEYKGGNIKEILARAKDRNIVGGVFHWNDLIGVFDRPKLSLETNTAYAGFSACLRAYFCPVYFGEEDIMALYDNEKRTGEAVGKLFSTIKKLFDNIDITTFPGKWEKSWGTREPWNEYGFYLKSTKPLFREVWVGMWMYYWAELEKEAYPLCIATDPETAKLIGPIPGLKSFKAPGDQTHIPWAIESKVFANAYNSVDAILELIRKVIAKIESTKKM